MPTCSFRAALALGAFTLFGPVCAANAQLMPQPITTFSGVALESLSSAPTGTPVNGVTIGQLTFGYTVNGIPATTAVFDGGPGPTNNVNPPNIVNNVNNAPNFTNASCVLTVNLSSPATLFGYGFAILGNPSTNGTTATAYNGVIPLGALTFADAPDPNFPGGFAGFSSATPFTSVKLTFDPVAAAFAADNFRFNTAAATPAPSSLLVVLGGMVPGVLFLRRRRK